MESNRRNFLKIGGVCALGLGSLPIVKALAQEKGPAFSADPRRLVAKRWAMVVDMKKCWEQGKPGCKDCVLACHTVHNVPDIKDEQEEIKWIWPEQFNHAFTGQENEFIPAEMKEKPFLMLCNHCTNPPCVRVCPTKATFKSPDGITMMDFHRCIGCRYCMAGCPYGARSFNWQDPRTHIQTELNMSFPTRERGVVEKCNFCTERLEVGLLPACVEACKVGGLIFGDIEDPNSNVRKVLAERFTMRRKPELGTQPNVYYIV